MMAPGAETSPSARRLWTRSLSRRQQLDAGYQVLWFAGDEPLEADAGQFTMVRSSSWGQAPLLGRPMSLLSAGAEPSILIKVVGEGTRRMAGAPIGETFHLLAPLGHAWPNPPDGARPLLVAGGVGVAPLIYLAERLAADPGRAPLLSLYGGRSARDLPLSERLEALGELGVTTEDGSRGRRGRVTLLLTEALEQAKRDGVTPFIYTCGPHAMMAAVAKLAADHRVACQASLEAPMGCGYGVCLGCPVARREGGYLYTCVDGPCVDAATIDWSQSVF
jgi:dihydroorotate dehydrogenase electron transfer subunit